MTTTRRALLSGAASGLLAPAVRAQPSPLRIGVLTDMPGPFSTNTGAGSVLAVRMAVEDFGGAVGGRPVEVIPADHQNRPDTGVAIVREWFDRQGVAAIADLVNSAVALVVMDVARQKDRITLIGGSDSPADWHGRETIRQNLRDFIDKGFTAHHDVVEYLDSPLL